MAARDESGVPRWFVLVMGVPLWLAAVALGGGLLTWAATAGHWVFFWIMLVAEIYAVVASVVVARRVERRRTDPDQ